MIQVSVEIAKCLVATRERAGFGQRELARKAGISQATLHRIETGDRSVQGSELVALAWALGCTVSELTGNSPVRKRARFAARGSGGSDMDTMSAELLHYLELDAYLEDQGIPQPA